MSFYGIILLQVSYIIKPLFIISKHLTWLIQILFHRIPVLSLIILEPVIGCFLCIITSSDLIGSLITRKMSASLHDKKLQTHSPVGAQPQQAACVPPLSFRWTWVLYV